RLGTRAAVPPRAPVSLPEAPAADRPVSLPRGTLHLSKGGPDVRLVPAGAVGRGSAAARPATARTAPRPPSCNAYPAAPPACAPAAMLARRRGLSVTADDVLVTRGSQMALTLAARALLRPGDVVAVEQFGYRPAWEAFRAAGATVVPVTVDRDGLDVDALKALA